MKPRKSENSVKRTMRAKGSGYRSSQFHPLAKGGGLRGQDFMNYSRLSPQKAMLLTGSIAIPYIAIALAIAFTVSTTVAMVICIPLISVFVIAGIMYWLGTMDF